MEINFAQPLFVLVDRIVLAPDQRARIVDGLEIGYRESGEAVFEIVPRDESPRRQLRFTQRFECKDCGRKYEEPEPRLFSFNNPYGACQRCQGFGNTIDFDLNLVIPNPLLTLNEGAIEPWTKPKYKTFQAELKRFAKVHDIAMNQSWCDYLMSEALATNPDRRTALAHFVLQMSPHDAALLREALEGTPPPSAQAPSAQAPSAEGEER